ncbi:MAG: hypothetical protein QM765_28640 [Myxococcales bacterium]
MLLSTLLMGLAQVALLAVNGVAIVAVVLRLWKQREPRPLARLVGRALAATWLLSIIALAIDVVMTVQEAIVQVGPADKATIVSAGLAEGLNCLALFVGVTLLPLAAYIYLRVSAGWAPPRAHFAVTRVPPPADREVEWEDVMAERPEIEAHRAEMLAIVHKEVEEYVNNPSLCCDARDFFPKPSALTGEYYIARESYFHPDADYDPQPDPWIQIGVMTKFLGSSQTPEGVKVHDYLGLQVWLRWTPKTKTFVIFRNTDSSSV